MKKELFTLLLLVASTVSFAQVNVDIDGKVSIGSCLPFSNIDLNVAALLITQVIAIQ